MLERLRTGRLAPIAPALVRIRRSDPFLMAAAIAYNTFFAIVPIAIAAVATVSLIGRSEGFDRFVAALTEVLPPAAADFIVDLIVDTEASLSGSQGIIIVISLGIALYSGSRAVYAVIKALRLIQAVDDERGWLRVRGLGIVFTIAAGIALMVGQVIVVIGGEVLQTIEELTEISTIEDIGGALSLPVIALWTMALFFAIYRWGPPEPAPHPLWSGIVTTVLVGLGSWVFGLLIPTIGLSAIGILGTVGVALLWVYYMALIVIVVPELVGAVFVLVKQARTG